MMNVRAGTFLFILLAAVQPVRGADSPAEEPASRKSVISLFDFTATPGIEVPLESGLDLLNLGATMDLRASLPLPFLPWLAATADISYSWLPTLADSSISLLSVGIGVRVTWEATRRLALYGFLSAGGYYGFFNGTVLDPYGDPYPDQQGGDPIIAGGAGVTFYLAPPVSLGVDLSVVDYLELTPSLRATLGASVHPDGFARKVALDEVEINDMFAPLFKRYADHPVGSAVLANEERFPIKDIAVSVFAADFMDSPTTCTAPDSLGPGEATTIDLNVLLSDAVLELKEATKIGAELKVEYTLNGRRRSAVTYQTIRLYGRNSITWDDDRKAAVFVTFADPEVLAFSKPIAGMVKEKGPKTVNQNLRMAMGVFDALSLYGLQYVVDPTTPSYQDAAKNRETIDFLQFPRQTLAFKAGDCDDLSIVLCTLLESVGVETAFITVPGHIFMAVSLDMTPAEARTMFPDTGDLVFVEKKTWLPIEATMIGRGFLSAWQTGAREWRDASATSQAALLPVHDSWNEYEVAGSPSDPVAIVPPTPAALSAAYEKEISALVDRLLQPKVRELQAIIAKTSTPTKDRNQLGVLYAQYGKEKEAEAEFLAALKTGDYVPALVNLGTIYLARGDFSKALDVLERAQRAAPGNGTVLINLARVNYELGNTDQVARYVDLADAQSPGLSERFSFLKPASGSSEARAADLERSRGSYLWVVEP